jgi:SAM-dependent methyltransferase
MIRGRKWISRAVSSLFKWLRTDEIQGRPGLTVLWPRAAQVPGGENLERNEYEKMERAEDGMWWYAGLHAHLLFFLRQSLGDRKNAVVLDAGCGTGGLLRALAEVIPQSCVLGLDADERACVSARVKTRCPVCVGSVDAIPFSESTFTAIVSADVLCHRSVDDVQALLNLNRCLATGGTLVLNLPAYQWLHSAHDRAVHQSRRYTRTRVHELLRAAGFAKIRTTYWNTFLFPLMVLRRMFKWAKGGSDVIQFPKPVNLIFRALMHMESILLRRGFTLPFGGSVLAVAVK